MQVDSRRSSQPEPNSVTKSGVLVLDGYGIRVAVERGHLVFADGYGRERRSGRVSRATSGLKRLVILGRSGTVSLDALRWLHDLGASFVHLDSDGTVITASAPHRLDDARVRRAQALTASTGVGLDIARALLRDKLTGQAAVLERLPNADAAHNAVLVSHAALDEAKSASQLRMVEAAAAAAYWGAWSNVTVRFARQDQAHVPVHWLTFGARTSALTGSPRKAINPANAILNYLYALLEVECVIALRTLGVDPGMGVLHADQWARDSLALDLMEAVRPKVDALVVELLARRVFTAREFFETRSGDCRLVAPLPRTLAELSDQLRREVAPIAERTMKQFSGDARATSSGRTPLTEANRSSGRDGVRSRPRRTAEPGLSVAPRCKDCGNDIVRGRVYCEVCLVEHEAEKLKHLTLAGPAALARARAAGRDPTATPVARARRSERRTEVWRLDKEWDALHPERPAPEVFARDVLPGLGSVTLAAMAARLSRRSWNFGDGRLSRRVSFVARGGAGVLVESGA